MVRLFGSFNWWPFMGRRARPEMEKNNITA
jgi:hypothetical protein